MMRKILKPLLATFSFLLVFILLADPLLAQDTKPLSPKEIATVFDYDPTTPLDINDVGKETRGNVIIRDITFSSPGTEQPISAYLIAPAASGTDYAGVLYVHWYEPKAKTSNRTQFVDEAVKMAEKGTVSLLVSTMWSDPKWFNVRKQDGDYQDAVNQVIALRRGLDVLLAQPGVNPKRIAYVGHDFGAMYGSVMAGAENRVQSYVLIAGTPSFYDWFVFNNALAGDELTAYQAKIGSIDPIQMIKTVKDAGFFFQFGEVDGYVPRETAVEFYMAAPDPKRIATYTSDHDMEHDIIQTDRMAWLTERLNLK
ncbi:MAG: hypothetical protein H0X30_02995 [Anaerolineae bacterium]|nr:hypothetical protein [Anaerolineae bacterium]